MEKAGTKGCDFGVRGHHFEFLTEATTSLGLQAVRKGERCFFRSNDKSMMKVHT